MKVLSIGNSFSQDAQRYLYLLAREAGIPLRSVNLMIGGCPLSRHFRNMQSGAAAYTLEQNGEATGFNVSLREALTSDDWDVVTLQQLSQLAPDFGSYQPYLGELSAYVARLCPRAKQVIHQTWAYEAGSRRLTEELHYPTPDAMFGNIKAAYNAASDAISAAGILPSGEAMLEATKRGIEQIHRDTFHAEKGAGRLLLAEVWLTALSSRDLRSVPVPKLDVPATEKSISVVREVAYETVRAYGWKIG